VLLTLALVGASVLSACQPIRDAGANPTIIYVSAPPETAAPPTSPPVQLYTNSNPGPAKVGAEEQAMFDITSGPVLVTKVVTYHYVEPNGLPSTGTIALVGPDNKRYGPWATRGTDGQGGIKNASWVATMTVLLPPGNYWVIDSDWTTWSSNADTGGAGMFWVFGYTNP